MTHKTIIFILVTTFTSLININAQNSVDDIPHEFFHIFKTEPMEALDYAYSTNRWMLKQVNRIEILKNELKDTWRIQDIVYNLDLTGEIIESAKIDRN